MSQLRLLRDQCFLPLFVTQFLGAFNDNLFKNALVILIVYRSLSWGQLTSDVLVPLGAGVFISALLFCSRQLQVSFPIGFRRRR